MKFIKYMFALLAVSCMITVFAHCCRGGCRRGHCGKAVISAKKTVCKNNDTCKNGCYTR